MIQRRGSSGAPRRCAACQRRNSSSRRTRRNGSSFRSRNPSCRNWRTKRKALITETSAAAASSEALRYSLRGARRRSSGSRGASRTLSIHWLRSENRYADSGGGSFCRCARRGGAALSFSRPGPTKCRKPSRSRMPTGDVGRELGEKTDQAIRGARRDCRGGDDGERRCRFRECLGIGPRLAGWPARARAQGGPGGLRRRP